MKNEQESINFKAIKSIEKNQELTKTIKPCMRCLFQTIKNVQVCKHDLETMDQKS